MSSSSSSLAPNKIHSLPVRVSYHLPSTSQIFSTLFQTPQQVYVHPNTAAASTSKNGVLEEEAWGSIYLKTVIMGVLMASPELHPSHPNTPDLSLYVLDPRETYLRRSRATGPSSSFIPQSRNHQHQHQHQHHGSSPSSDYASSPNLSYGMTRSQSQQSSSVHEVWTGKGLVSWALDEPGQGKNLITGRLIRSNDFSNINTPKQFQEGSMNALEALMMSNSNKGSNEESWGIEIFVGLKSGLNTTLGSQHNKVSNSMMIDGRPDALRRSSTTSSTETQFSTHSYSNNAHASTSNINHFQKPPVHTLPKKHEQPPPRRPHLPTPPSSSAHSHTHSHQHQPLVPTRTVSASKNAAAKPTEKQPAKPGRKRKTRNSSIASTGNSRNSLSNIDTNSESLQRTNPTNNPPHHTLPQSILARSSVPPSSDAVEPPFPTDIPAGLFARPESLTREQAQRLLASPAFLSMLEKLTGAPVDTVAAAKRSRENDDDQSTENQSQNNKKQKLSSSSSNPNLSASGNGNKGSGTTSSNDSSSNDSSHNAFVCWNCGRIKSAVWRTKVMEGGISVRVCNACGLYWNQKGSMRPPTLWGDVDDDPKDRPRKEKRGGAGGSRQSSQAPMSEPDIPAVRIDKPIIKTNNSDNSNGFKRTLSSVVEEDAKRIQASNSHHYHHQRHNIGKQPLPRSGLNQTSKPVPMSSPPRGSTSATKSLRNPHQVGAGVAASSPIRWNSQQLPQHHQQHNIPKSDNFHTDPVESPVTAARIAYGKLQSQMSSGKKNTLDMPLSDDNPEEQKTTSITTSNQNQQINWGTDLSAFFNTEGFSMPSLQDKTHGISPDIGPPTEFQKSLSAEAIRSRKRDEDHIMTDQSTGEEDDVLSQLFNRTSSSSSVGVSPIHPFDFSALPPSSPPLSISSRSELPHSALLLSSPDVDIDDNNSPSDSGLTPNDNKSKNGYSPLMEINQNHNNNQNQRIINGTPGKSGLRNSFTVNNSNNENANLGSEDFQRMFNNLNNNNQNDNTTSNLQNINNNNNNQNESFDMLNEIFGKLDNSSLNNQIQNQNQNQIQNLQQNQPTSSVGQADELIGGDNSNVDLFAMIENNSFA
ncbi:uncharacterized protein L201_004033 [Kwoniella dendrophila CBS 6074]|uniref:GATA-type domain-containing protein n=1 Tax=Kwoniella dendrophila CBS 6074 TaxID=1295534 RepID=A0AAX4JX57_9TREE